VRREVLYNILIEFVIPMKLSRFIKMCLNETYSKVRELHNLYSSPSIIRIIKPRTMRRAGHVARMGEKRNVYRLLVGKPEGKRPLGRPIRRWIYKIKRDLLEIGFNVVNWIGLAQDRYRWRALVNSVMNLRVP
jgi:hypothetical protein